MGIIELILKFSQSPFLTEGQKKNIGMYFVGRWSMRLDFCVMGMSIFLASACGEAEKIDEESGSVNGEPSGEDSGQGG